MDIVAGLMVMVVVFGVIIHLAPSGSEFSRAARFPTPEGIKLSKELGGLYWSEICELDEGLKTKEQIISERRVPGISNKTPLPPAYVNRYGFNMSPPPTDWDKELKELK